MPLFEKEVRQKAEEFIRTLSEENFFAEIIEDSFRDYTAKISVEHPEFPPATVSIYFSPKKNSYTIKVNSKEEKLIRIIEDCWEGNFAKRNSSNKNSSDKISSSKNFSLAETQDRKGCEIYVDGSYIGGKTGYGAVILLDGKPVKEFCGPTPVNFFSETRQVAGELFATGKAIQWCRENNIREAKIFFDYEGIEKWATGAWKARQEMTQKYAEYIRGCGIKISWQKVKSHTGDYWNEYVDKLAKRGAEAGK